MQLESEKLLHDIRRASELVLQFTTGRELVSLLFQTVLIHAVDTTMVWDTVHAMRNDTGGTMNAKEQRQWS